MAGKVSIGGSLARKLAQAVCGDDHLMCSWPTCGCKQTKRKINAVALVVSEHLDDIENRISDALAITRRDDDAGRAHLASHTEDK
jgi:hypothetical protein